MRSVSPGVHLVLIFALAVGCEKQEGPKPTASGAAVTPSTSPTTSAVTSVTAKDLEGLSHRKAKDALVALGWRGQNASTGPNEGAFSLSTSKDDGSEVEVEMHVFESEFEKKALRPRAIKDAVFAEGGKRLLSVRANSGGSFDQNASRAVLDALFKRARDPEEPFAWVKAPETAWLAPSIQTVDDYLVIAPKLADATTTALTALGYQNVTRESEQKRNTKNPKDTGFPGLTLRADKADDRVGVSFRCLTEDTDKQFFPKPHDADLGEAIWFEQRCKVVVSVIGKTQQWSDKAKAKSLLEKLLTYKPAPG